MGHVFVGNSGTADWEPLAIWREEATRAARERGTITIIHRHTVDDFKGSNGQFWCCENYITISPETVDE